MSLCDLGLTPWLDVSSTRRAANTSTHQLKTTYDVIVIGAGLTLAVIKELEFGCNTVLYMSAMSFQVSKAQASSSSVGQLGCHRNPAASREREGLFSTIQQYSCKTDSIKT